MVTVSVELPDDVAARAAALAADRGVSVDQLASDALQALLEQSPVHPAEPRLSFIGMIEGRPGYSARVAEQELEDYGFKPLSSS